MPASVIKMVKKTLAYGLILTWVEMECAEALVQETAGALTAPTPSGPSFERSWRAPARNC